MGFRTQRDVDRLTPPPGKGDVFYFDEEARGLSVRIQGDRRTWVVHYTAGGKRRRMSLGDVPALPLRDARNKAGKILADAKDGKDTLAVRAATAKKAGNTVGRLVTRYITQYAEKNQRPRTLVETKRALERHLLPLHDIEVAAISRAHVAGRLYEVAGSSGPIMANRCRAALSHCFAWAIQQGLADSNPVVGTARPAPEVKRERVLSDAELVLLWRATEDGGDYSRIVRLLLLLGQRRDEVAAMTWAELDTGKALWTIPGARAKNGKVHEVPLSRQALAEIGAKPKGDRTLVFGKRAGPYQGFCKGKVGLDAKLARLRGEPLPGWVIHDLRRTAVTGMAEIGVQPHVVEACVNHLSGHKGGIAGVYNRAIYATEKRAALQRWSDHIARLVSGSGETNVVSLTRVG